MKILFLTQILPYPPNAGPRVKTWHVIKHLANMGVEITLVTFIRDEEEPYIKEVQKYCKQVFSIPIKRSRVKDIVFMAKSILTNTSFLVTRDQSNLFTRTINRIVGEETFDAIHADQLTMAQFAIQAKIVHQSIYPDKTEPKLVFDAHNATWTILERMETQVNSLLEPIVHLEKKRVKNYESFLLDTFDHTLAVTEIDKLALLNTTKNHSQIDPTKIEVIPIAVDTELLSPVNKDSQTHQIITLGTLNYPPNADGIRWFMREVFPKIHQDDPLAQLTVIGKNPPKDFYQIQEHYPDSIHITGYVDDLLPYLKQADLMVVPVLAGGGMRVRILEAFSRQIPVITTTIGLEGIDAKPGQDVLVADSAQDFGQAVLHLLNSPDEQKRIAINGRNLVQKYYDWTVVFKALNKIYQIDDRQAI